MKKRAVFVLGPHRSGTSLITSAIEALGFSLGSRSDWLNEDNPKGFFENREITPFNDRLLAFLGGRWDSPAFNGRRALASTKSEELAPWYDEAGAILTREFRGDTAWVVKDPRLCLLLPFWHEVLHQAGYEKGLLSHVYVLRNPIEVARSQQRRHNNDPAFHFLGESLDEGLMLWHSYALQALEGALPHQNICVDYQELLQHPREQIGRLARFLEVSPTGADIDEWISGFLDEGLYRNRATEDELREHTARYPFVYELDSRYRALASGGAFNEFDEDWLDAASVSLRQIADQGHATSGLYSRAYTQWQEARQSKNELAHEHEFLQQRHDALEGDYRALVEENRMLEEQRHLLEIGQERLRVNLDISEDELKRSRSALEDVRSQLDAVYATVSWRITWPLRMLMALVRRDRKTASEELIRAHAGLTRLRAHTASRYPRFYRSVMNPMLEFFIGLFKVPLKKFYLAELEELAAHGGVDPRITGMSLEGDDHGFDPSERFLSQDEFEPQVTVVVPNYNHAGYLRKRLDSIYQQTYSNIRVLLLDDCSKDESREVLSEYAERYADKTLTLFNETNSGNVFRQWARGIENATSDLVWIAESDDFCDPDFLEKLIPYFKDEGVQLAYARSTFVDEEDAPTDFTFEHYLSDISLTRWKQPYVETAHREVADALGQKNTIPNVSSAVFRKGRLDSLLADEDWLGMRICGDWVFYLQLIRGGKIAYTPETSNYYRYHTSNASVATYSREAYYQEHEAVACEVARLYAVPDETLQAHGYFVERFFLENGADLIAKGTQFESLYSAERIQECRRSRLPNLLIACYAFSTGGGEVFPIRMAIGLHQRGYGVTFFNFNGAPVNENMRRLLPAEIPVVELGGRFVGVDAVLERFGIELVHSHHASVDHFFAMGRLRTRETTRHVITTHGMYESMDADIFATNVVRMAPKIDKWVYIADKNLVPFEERNIFSAARFTKIGNGMTRPEINPVDRDSLNIEPDAFVICLASRALIEKGWREAIRMTEQARSISGKSIHLVLLGDGPVYDELLREKLPDHVHLMGFQQNAVDFYAMADAGILPTRFQGESFPLTVIECLMVGRPVIASDLGETRNMLTNDDGEVAGYVLPLEKDRFPVAAAARHLADLVMDRELYARKQELAVTLAPRFDMERVLDEYGAVYTEVLSPKPVEHVSTAGEVAVSA